jgi:hypothetical protein
LLGVIGQNDAELGRTGDFRAGLTEGFEHRAFSKGLEILGPALVVAEDGDLEGNCRIGAQSRPASSAALRRCPSAS